MKDAAGVNHFELTDEEKKLVTAALQRIIVRGRSKRVEGATLIAYQRLVAKFSNKNLVRVGRKNLLLEKEEPKKRLPDMW